MNIYSQKGFTLIELLVVIAIIGILSMVVVTNLNDARKKSSDVAIKANLATIKVQSEFYYDNIATGNGTYGTAAASTINLTTGECGSNSGLFTDTVIKDAMRTALAQSSDTTKGYCMANVTGWGVSIPFKSNALSSWCIGNIGKASAITTPLNAAAFTGCP